MPPLWVGQHLSSVWSLDGSSWQQVMTPECGLCIAQVWRAIISSWEAHQAMDPDMFIPLWTGSWFYLVGRERLANSQRHQICRWVSWGKEKGKERIHQETKILLFCLQAPSWHNFVSKQTPFRTLAPSAFSGYTTERSLNSAFFPHPTEANLLFLQIIEIELRSSASLCGWCFEETPHFTKAQFLAWQRY